MRNATFGLGREELTFLWCKHNKNNNHFQLLNDGPVYITQCPIKPGAISLMKSYSPQRKEPYGGIPIVIALVPLSMVLSLFFLKQEPLIHSPSLTQKFLSFLVRSFSHAQNLTMALASMRYNMGLIIWVLTIS